MLSGVVDQRGVELIARVDLPGGRAMQVQGWRHLAFVGHLTPGQGTTVVDLSDPARPRVIGSLPGAEGSVSAKVQVVGERLYVSYEERAPGATRKGFGVFALAEGRLPEEVAYVDVGGRGVHRMWCTGGLLYASARPEGFRDRMLIVYDVADPRDVRRIGCWWIPGLAAEEEPPPTTLAFNLHHPVVVGTRAYLGCWDAGFKILDVADPARPRVVGEAGGWAPEEGGATHTALPIPRRRLLVVADEAMDDDRALYRKRVRVFSIEDETRPTFLAFCPDPPAQLARRGGRFGPHNLHEPRPEGFFSDTLVFATYYAGGLRLFDLTDPSRPQEVGAFVPEAPDGGPIQLNDLYVRRDGLILVTDRGAGGLYVLRLDPRLKAAHESPPYPL